MASILVSALVAVAQVSAVPSSAAPPVLAVPTGPVVLTTLPPAEPNNCALEIFAISDPAVSLPTRIQYYENGQVRIVRPLSEVESTRPTAELLIQLDDGWYAQGRAGLYRVGSADNDPVKASAPYIGMTMEPVFIEAIASAKTMQFWDNTIEQERFDLGAIDRIAIKDWKNCIDNLKTVVPPTDPFPVSYSSYYRRQMPLQPITPINKQAWITADDYPSRALRSELQGTVAYTVTVNVNGRVQSCEMTKNENPTIVTSVNDMPDLNIATCRNITRRARFIPATDAAGRPLVANYSGRVRWALPYDPPPPPPPPPVR